MLSRKVIVIFFLPTEFESACVITSEKWYGILFNEHYLTTNECKIFHLHYVHVNDLLLFFRPWNLYVLPLIC